MLAPALVGGLYLRRSIPLHTRTENDMANIYREHGFENREAYLADLADEYGVDVQVLYMVADLLGPNEDFDGLVSAVQDYAYLYS